MRTTTINVRVTLSVLALLLLAGAAQAAEPRLVVYSGFITDDDGTIIPPLIHYVDSDDQVETVSPPVGQPPYRDLVVTESGRIATGGARVGVHLKTFEWEDYLAPFAEVEEAEALGVEPGGTLLALAAKTFFAPGRDEGLYRIQPDASYERIATAAPEHHWTRGDQALAGPLAGSFLTLGYASDDFGARTSFDWLVFRLEIQADGSVLVSEPWGPPTGLSSYLDCFEYRPGRGPALAVRADGESVLISDTCTGDIHEYDLEGNSLGVFAHSESDREVPTYWDDGDPAGSTAPDRIVNIHVTPDDHLYVLFSQRIAHFDSEGEFLRFLDVEIPNRAFAIGNAFYSPPDRGACAPESLGWWKRQCLGADGPSGPRGSLPGMGLSRGPGAHSALSAEDFEAARSRADAQLAEHGVGACEALREPRRGNTRLQALRELAVARLNQAAKLLHGGCLVRFSGRDRDVGDVLIEAEALLTAGGNANEREAAKLLHALATGRVSDPNANSGDD